MQFKRKINKKIFITKKKKNEKPINGKFDQFVLVIANKDVKYGQKHENSLFMCAVRSLSLFQALV